MADAVFYPTIEEHRKRVGATKVSVAEILGIHENTASKKLNGESEFTFSECVKLADCWGITLDELAGR